MSCFRSIGPWLNNTYVCVRDVAFQVEMVWAGERTWSLCYAKLDSPNLHINVSLKTIHTINTE